MTGLSREDRAELIAYLRAGGDGHAIATDLKLRAWADKLEAGPEPVSVEPVATLWRCPEHGVTVHGCTAEHDCDNVVTPVPVSPTADLEALQQRLNDTESKRGALENVVVGAMLYLDAEGVPDDEHLEDRLCHILRERDEAREALRELRDAVNGASAPPFASADMRANALRRAMESASDLIKGVERTHALVQRTFCRFAADLLTQFEDVSVVAVREHLDALARGEHVQWPETAR